MEPAFRCGTKEAMDELAKELNLPNESWMQDWPYEVVNKDNIEDYFLHYDMVNNDDKKFILMEMIIQSIEEHLDEEKFIKYWNRVKPLLDLDFSVHEYTIYYWSCMEESADNLADCWRISYFMRELWNEKNKIYSSVSRL